MEDAMRLARAKGAKERMAGVERLLELLEACRKSLSASVTASLVECCLQLQTDTNFKVSQLALQALASAAVLSGDHFKLHFRTLLPAVVQRLADPKQPVRDAARTLLLTLMEISSPTIIVEKAGCFAWRHESFRVREEFARTVTSAIALFGATELPLQRAILPSILKLLNDSNHGVREAATLCIEEMYTKGGSQFRDELDRHHLPESLVEHINSRLERIQPQNEVINTNLAVMDLKNSPVFSPKCSPRPKGGRGANNQKSMSGGEEFDITTKINQQTKVYSDVELTMEIDKISSMLSPHQDWSVRVGAMQRLESLVLQGAATSRPVFRALLKQLISPFIAQLSDRRSSIVKQVCHLLCFLSKELLGDFEECAEILIPVLLKLVVITVLVIAESADKCIKTMLHNCKIARVLPHIADLAKNDHSAVLRARCCEYAVLMLEKWSDSPEIQKSVDLYEDVIQSCVADAVSEVRATARMCYRMFSKTWPERSRRLFLLFDSKVQRIIKEEDRGSHQHYTSSIHENSKISLTQESNHSTSLDYGTTSALVSMDRSISLPTGISASSSLLFSPAKSIKMHINKDVVCHNVQSRRRRSYDENKQSSGDPSSCVNSPSSLTDALTRGLSPSSDWSAKVAAFKYLQSLLQKGGPKETQEVDRNFEKVMKLFFHHLDDPHHKVAQAALCTLADIIKSCQKPFESYMERILPHVFSRLIDPNYSVTRPCSTILEILTKSYTVESLLPSLVRSLDEQRSPKAKLAVVEYAINCFNKSDGSINVGVLKLWLSKLAAIIVWGKSGKLREAAISCIISVYSHYDSVAVLNFIVGLSVEEQSCLRRVLRQNTPRIEVELMNLIQVKKEKRRLKSFYDSSDIASEDGRSIMPSRTRSYERKWGSAQSCGSRIYTTFDKIQDDSCHDFTTSKIGDSTCAASNSLNLVYQSDSLRFEGFSAPNLESTGSISSNINADSCGEPSISQISDLIDTGNSSVGSSDKLATLEKLVEVSEANDGSVSTKHLQDLNEILEVELDALDDADSSIREQALLATLEMINNHKDMMEPSPSVGRLIEKLLHVKMDSVASVSDKAEQCLSLVLSLYDPSRCLRAMVHSLLVTEDERSHITSINCITKLMDRFSQEELMIELPRFLPSLFEAFGNHSADVRKSAVLCLVDIYIKLGKAFLPHLEGLSSTQLRLVTIYANRISQARAAAT